jgi:hypothetical protein
VPQLPIAVVHATLAQATEIPATVAWAKRRNLDLTYDEAKRALELDLAGPSEPPRQEREPYRITALLEDYNLLPPIWRFVDPRNGDIVGVGAYPRPTGPSVLHSNGLVCAPCCDYSRHARATRA